MSAPTLTVGRPVLDEVIRLAAMEVPGVVRVDRGGPPWRRFVVGAPVSSRIVDGRVEVRVAIVARPGHALGPLARQVGASVEAAIERLVGMEVGGVVVLVDGVGA